MRVRIAVAGVLAGVICIAALYIPYYRFEPADFVIGWPYAIQAAQFPLWLPQAALLFCILTLFSFGWVAARWNWARDWKASVLAGAGTGVLAGCLIYGLMGVFWFGLLGQAEILKNFYLPIDEPQGTKVLLEALFQTGTSLYTKFIFILTVCVLCGALGGLASALIDAKDFWGRRPRSPQGWLFRLPAYLLVIFGVLNLIVTQAILATLWEKSINSALELQKQYDLKLDLGSDQIFLPYAYLAGFLFTFLPMGITWGWIMRAWRSNRKPSVLALLWLALTGALVIYVFPKFLQMSLVSGIYGLGASFILAGFVLIATPCIGLLVGWMAKPYSEGEPYHITDWVGFLVTYGVLGGTQIVMGAPAFAIPFVMIALINIPHLTASGIVEKSPVEQVVQLFSLQSGIMQGLILVCMVIGLIAAGLVGLLRGVFGIRNPLPEPEASSESMNHPYR